MESLFAIEKGWFQTRTADIIGLPCPYSLLFFSTNWSHWVEKRDLENGNHPGHVSSTCLALTLLKSYVAAFSAS